MKINNLPILKFNVLALFFVLAVTLGSCSSDDEPACPGFIDLPANLVSTYQGILTVDGVLVAQEGTATIERTNCTYTINFSNDVPSITDVVFVQSNDTYAYVNSNATTTVNVGVEGGISIGKSDAPTIGFNGELQ